MVETPPGSNGTLFQNSFHNDVIIGSNENSSLINGTSDSSSDLLTLYAVLDTVIFLVIIFGNGLVLVAVAKFEVLRSSINVFVVNLALADLLLALCLPLHIAMFFFPELGTQLFLCLGRSSTLICSCGASTMTLVLISLERYIAIHKPYKYSTIFPTRRCVFCCIGIWVYVFGCSILPLVGWNRWSADIPCNATDSLAPAYLVFILAHVIVSLFGLMILYGRMYKTAKKKFREIQNQIHPSNSGEQNCNRFYRDSKASKTVKLVVGMFALSYTPFTFVILTELFLKEIGNEIPSWLKYTRVFTNILVFVNSCLNPLIYHRRLPQFKKAFHKLLGIKSSRLDDFPGAIQGQQEPKVSTQESQVI